MVALKVYPDKTDIVNMSKADFSLNRLKSEFDNDPKIWRIEFVDYDIIFEVWEKEVKV